MPDFIPSPASDGTPSGWAEAFAALPPETPPGDGWSRVAARLDAPTSRRVAAHRERRTNWLVGLASAAVLALAAWSPLSHWLQNDGSEATPAIAATSAPGSRGPAAPVQAEARKSVEATTDRVAATAQATRTTATPAGQIQPRSERSARVATARSRTVDRRATPGAQPTGVQAPHAPSETNVATSTAETGAATNAPLLQLKAQSAQLEALVAMARDDRVGNASNQLLSSELDAGIAAVDAALSQADVAASRQQELWQQRVDLLQQLAGVEATSRWLAAQGMSNETLLVSVD